MEFVKAQVAEGKTKEEITAALMSQDKIGTSNPTAELVDALYEEATATVPDETPIASPAPTPPAPKSPYTHEKWRVEVDKFTGAVTSEIAKLKDVNIPDSLAEMLNRGLKGQERGIFYKKK